MRGALICAWLLVPAVVAAYHYGPGQEQLQLDDAAVHLRQADAHVAAGEFPEATDSYDAALAVIPAANVNEVRRVRLERAKAEMLAAKLPEAYDELAALGDELSQDPIAPRELIDETRAGMANAQYYMTWLMRLEGRPRDEWEPVIESSRQYYRLLAEGAAADSDEQASQEYREDLEAAIRLARMDLSDLQALPLPSQCKGCCSGNCNGVCKKKGKTDKPKTGKKDARGASGGPPPDGRGS